MTIQALREHQLLHTDAALAQYAGKWNMILTSPPSYHPVKEETTHGVPAPRGTVDGYAAWVGRILARAVEHLHPDGVLITYKTDVYWQGKLTSICGEFIRELPRALALPLRRHWIYVRKSGYSPFSPCFSHILVFGNPCMDQLTKTNGIFDFAGQVDGNSNDATPLCRTLIERFTQKGDVVLDPFVGTGCVSVAAKGLDRWSTGLDISKEMIATAKRRMK